MEIIVRSPFLKQYTDVLEVANTNGLALISRHQMLAQNALIRDLIDAGLWTDMRNLIVYSTDGSGQFNRVDLRTPSNTLATYAGTLTFITNIGWQGDASTGTITIVNGATNGQDCFFFCKSYDNIAGSSGRIMGARDGAASNQMGLAPRSGTNNAVYTIQDSSGGSVANSDSSGYYSLVGKSTYRKLYKNGSEISAISGSPVGSISGAMRLLSDVNSGSPTFFSAYTLQVYIAGLSSLESGISTLESIYNTYLNRI